MTDPLPNSALRTKYKVRAANWDDVTAIVALRNASSQSTRGTDVAADHWQRRHWHESGIDFETDTVLVLDGEKAIAYAELVSESPYIVFEMVGVVHPDYRGQGIGTQLVHWAEERVSLSLEKAPDGAAVFIQNSIFDSNQPGRALFETHGYEIVRDFVHLQIEMENKSPDPIWPAGIEVRPLQTADWEKLGPAMSDAFSDHWGIVEYESEEQDDSEKKDEISPEERDPEAFNEAYFNSPGLCFDRWEYRMQ